MKYIIYKKDTGEILSNNVSTRIPTTLNIENAVMKGEYDPEKVYIEKGIIVDRPRQKFSLSSNVLYGILTNSSISVNTRPVTKVVADGTPLRFTFDTNDTYIISISLWPYQTLKVSINEY